MSASTAPHGRALSLVAFASLLTAASAVRAEPVVVERLPLALDGSPLDLGPALGLGGEIELRGTVSSTHDLSVMDAFSRRVDGRTFVADGPFVWLPEGSELVAADRAAHTYRVRLPPHDRRIAFAIGRVASAQLQTRGETYAGLRGGIEVWIVRPSTAPAVLEAEEEADPVLTASVAEAQGVSGFALAGTAVATPLLGWALLRRRRRDAWRPLMKRAERARRATDAEAARLGPAFSPVVLQAEEVFGVFERVRAHARATEASAARIRGEGREARARRAALRAEAGALVARGEALVDRLEGVAASLAAEVAEQQRVDGVEARVSALAQELELAVSCDREARA